MKKSVILCVDDEKMVLNSLKSELKEYFGKNHIIEVCEDPLESIEIFQELLDDGYEIPLIISDYVMPVMKGDELLKTIHEIAPNSYKIMLTGQATTEGVSNAVNNGGLYRYIGKPWQANDLCMSAKQAIQSFYQEQKLEQQRISLKTMNEELEQKVEERTQEIFIKIEELNQQKIALNNINKDITDSIKAASKIQGALLPAKNVFNNYFQEHFILYKPRDIVSGDFYWSKEVDNCVYFAAADCTGHGVPGALMSMLGISILNEIIASNISKTPANILHELRDRIKQTLNQNEVSFKHKEGMDMALCMIDLNTNKLGYAGAYNPLYRFRRNTKNEYEFSEIKADRMPVGVYPKDHRAFTEHWVDIQKDDTYYIFSDGYVSQFGSTDNRKLLPKRFREVLLNIQCLNMEEQETKLDDFFMEWKKDNVQVDDVLVMGVKIKDFSRN